MRGTTSRLRNTGRALATPLGIAAVLIAAGAVFGLAVRGATADECIPTTILDIEGPFAQDVNGDGMATIAEGMIDMNGNGRFDEFEANALGLCNFVHWGEQTGEQQTTVMSQCAYCQKEKQFGQWVKTCRPIRTWDCYGDGVSSDCTGHKKRAVACPRE